jgi:hypothetical protein
MPGSLKGGEEMYCLYDDHIKVLDKLLDGLHTFTRRLSNNLCIPAETFYLASLALGFKPASYRCVGRPGLVTWFGWLQGLPDEARQTFLGCLAILLL